MNKIAIIGATGATGLELIELALKDGIDPQQIIAIASEKSVGKIFTCQKQKFVVQSLLNLNSDEIDTVFLAAGSSVSEAFKNRYQNQFFVIDLSSKYRMNENCPLVIPEINPQASQFLKHRWICSPNCVTTITLLVLGPLIKQWPSKKIILSTYQAASGAGLSAMHELKNESQAFLSNSAYKHTAFNDPYAFNLFTHNAPFSQPENNDEEIKIIQESRKILNDPKLKISATCVRVPTLRAHAISAYVEFNETPTKQQLYDLLKTAPGIKLFENFSQNKFATPQIATCQNEVLYGRIRKDTSCDHSFWFWIVGDQLLKGAALNAWQIFKLKRIYEALHPDTRSNSSCISS